MTSSTRQSETTPWPEPTPPDFTVARELLNLLPGPAFILDRANRLIVIANPNFIHLTGFSEEEVIGQELEKYFLGIETKDLQPDENHSGALKRKNHTSLPVKFQSHSLGGNDAFCVVALKNPESPSALKGVTPEHDHLLEILLYLLTCQDAEDLDLSIKNTLDAFSMMIGTNLICLYQANSNTPGLKKAITCEPRTVFPPEIPPNDLTRLSSALIWSPGAHVQTEIHKAGRMAELKYVASIPLGQKGALTGLLVLGGTEGNPPANLRSFLQFFSTLITTKTQNIISDENLRNHIFELENQNDVMHEMFEAAQEGIIILNSNKAVYRMNSTAELLLGYAETEVQGQFIENILIGPDGLIRALEKVDDGIPIHNLGAIHIHHRNGQSFPANLQIIPVMKEGQLFSILIFITDVSQDEQIRIRTQQLEHRAVLGEFTAVFAHEVRNPINNISTGLQLLGTLLKAEDPNQKIIARMIGDCNRLDHLMESVLSFSRPLETKFEPVDLVVLLQRILDRWRPRLATLNIELFFQPVTNLPRITGDVRSLEQVFTNLISNAVEVMSKNGGTLAIRMNRFDQIQNNPQVEVAITDNGPGIPDEIKSRIFEPFISNNPRGTGLGLAITKRILTAHHGSITVDTFPGGTVFKVYLPVDNGEMNEHHNPDR